jgi:cytochrome c-type biogenesis protein
MDIAVTSFVLGLLSAGSPCILPLYPGFLAYLSGQSETEEGKRNYFLGAFVLLGVLSMMLLLGAIIALLAVPVGSVLAYMVPIADLLILALGVALLLNYNPFKTLPQVQVPFLKNPNLNAYVYGLLYGPIALPCSGPLLVGIFALSFTLGEAFSKFWVFIWYGLGFGLPLLVLSLLSGSLQRQITRQFAQRARLINIIGGLLLIGIAVYDLYKNWALIRVFFS